MYNSSSYAKEKFSLDTKKMHKSKGKSCGYYWRIIFFFSSLIQSLIIVSLVLFMVYGHPEQSSEKRAQELQSGFSKLSSDNKLLREKNLNLTQILNITLTKKLSDDISLRKLRLLANMSTLTIIDLRNKLVSCQAQKISPPGRTPPLVCPAPPSCQTLIAKITSLELMMKILETNSTQIVQNLRRELDTVTRVRDSLHLEVIGLRRNTSDLQKQLDAYGHKCKGDFVQSLDGIHQVTRKFIEKIEGLVPLVFPFKLTCMSQKDQLEQIRLNCSSLSREVETKFQSYLDSVGTQVSQIQARSSQLEVESRRAREDLHWCRQNHTAATTECTRQRQEVRDKHDRAMESLLTEQKRLRDTEELQRQQLEVKKSEITALSMEIKRLNTSLASCTPKVPFPKFPQFFGSVTPDQNIPLSTFPKPGSPEIGFNFPSFPKPGQTGAGTPGTGMNFPVLPKPGQTGPVLPGTGVNIPTMHNLGAAGGSYYDLNRHLKELQEEAKKN
ncbi:hypothetical protein AGOR_G00244110 [Albula goreensis]|uniref:Uncharacterized protein n=1 Tax=Albula goreensis TaxID=1534307 RepID=A0A8T3CEG3_9TELE|nr:hypothetical protein AGOR_G00244110 [Albula goreensis]